MLYSYLFVKVYPYYTGEEWSNVTRPEQVVCDVNLIDTGVWAIGTLMQMYMKVQGYV